MRIEPRDQVADALAALSMVGLVLPEAVAYSGVANLPPIAGLIAAGAGLLIYGLLGTSRYAIVTATSSSAAVLAAAVHSLGAADTARTLSLAAALVLLSGVLFLACAGLRLGHMTQFIARPVLRGLALGIALLIAIRQLAQMLGLHTQQMQAIPLLLEIGSHLGQWNPRALGLGLGSFLLLSLLQRWPRLPAALVLMIASLIVIHLWPALASGVAVAPQLDLSHIGLAWPDVPPEQWLRLAELAVALMLVLFAESFSSIRSFALDDAGPPHTNRDLLALGSANVVAGLFGGAPAGAGYSATAANVSFGAHTRLSGLFTALCLPVFTWFGLRWLQQIPQPVFAAIVLHAVRHSLDPAPLRRYLLWRRDLLPLTAALIATLLLGPLDGLLLAIGLSLAVMIRNFAQPRISRLGRLDHGHDFVGLRRYPQAIEVPGVLILRPEEPLFFGNVEAMLEAARTQWRQGGAVRALLLSLEESPDLDGTCVESLGQFAARVSGDGVQLWLARLKDPALQVLTVAQLPGLPPQRLRSGSVDAVVRELQASLEMRSGGGEADG